MAVKNLKTSGNILLPRLDKVQDPETKRVFQQLLRTIREMNITAYGDLMGLEERITTLEP